MNDFIELRRIAAAILRRWWILLLGLVLGAALGYAVSQRLSPVYQATATLIVGQSIQATNPDSRDIQTSEMLALTYADMARRQPVLQRTVEALELDINWQLLKKQVRVSPVAGTQLLEVKVEADSPETAKTTANEIARQLILLSPTRPQDQESEVNTDFVQQRLDSLQERIDRGQIQIEELENAMLSMSSASEMSDLQDQVNTLEGLITSWEDNYARLLPFIRDENSINNLDVIEEARVNSNPVRPRVELNTVLAATVGLFLALGLVGLVEVMDDTIKSTITLSQGLSLVPLGEVRQMKVKRDQDKLITSQGPFTPASEAYRMIRSNIRFIFGESPSNVILVTGPTAGVGKSLTVANLGLAMAQAGLKTIIVDADLRQPTQHKIFQLSNKRGLTELLRAQKPDIIGSLRSPGGVESLQLLTGGELPPNPSELLSSERMELLLDGLAKLADIVILDGPPALSAADAAILSNQVDGVVLVIEAGRTRRHESKQAISVLQQAGANLLGAVLNRAPTGPRGTFYPYQAAANGYGQTGQAADNRWWQVWRSRLSFPRMLNGKHRGGTPAKQGRPLEIEWQENAEDLEALYRAEQDVHRRKRLHALWLLRKGKSLTEVSELLTVGYRTLQRWVAWYRSDGLAEVLRRTPINGVPNRPNTDVDDNGDFEASQQLDGRTKILEYYPLSNYQDS